MGEPQGVIRWSPTFNDNKEVDDYSEDDFVNGAEEINGDISKQMNLDDETDIEVTKAKRKFSVWTKYSFPPGFTLERISNMLMLRGSGYGKFFVLYVRSGKPIGLYFLIMDVKGFWGNVKIEFTISRSSCLNSRWLFLCMGYPSVFCKELHGCLGTYFVASIWSYGFPNSAAKLIVRSVRLWDGHCLVMGDFNLKLVCMEDRFGFSVQCARASDQMVSETWNNIDLDDNNKMVRFKKKLQILKKEIRSWVNDCKKNQSGRLVEYTHSGTILQKAKIQWAIEGDENSKFFHGIINRKRANLAIKGVMVDGEWLDMLESPISRDEVRNVVWGCGENKSPGPDGFTFEFFRKFWDTLGDDLCDSCGMMGVEDLNGEGVFRVKDVRILLDECFLPKAPTATRWVKYVPIKINVFAWKVFLDRLPTRSNLQHHGVLVSDLLCPLCPSAQEDSSHLFFSCRLATDIVRLVCNSGSILDAPGSMLIVLNGSISSIKL
ncbi:RNA-directed DNA polymerase, eukaryota [Tanacetum coccineum]